MDSKELLNPRLNNSPSKKNNTSRKIIKPRDQEKKLNKDQAIDLIVIKTRHYAKRQATWARGQMTDWKIVSALDSKLSLKKLLN